MYWNQMRLQALKDKYNIHKVFTLPCKEICWHKFLVGRLHVEHTLNRKLHDSVVKERIEWNEIQ